MTACCHPNLYRLIVCLLSCLAVVSLQAQPDMPGGKKIPLLIQFVDKDSSFQAASLKLQNSFESQASVTEYVQKLPSLLLTRGYPAASVDSSWFDILGLHIRLYLGQAYEWMDILPGNLDKKELAAAGYREKDFRNRPMDMTRLIQLQQRLLTNFENQGHPFATVTLDSVQVEGNRFRGQLMVNRGISYKIDSIRVFGKLKIRKYFLHQYLNIPPGSLYSKEKLMQVDKRMQELQFLTPLQPSDLTMLGSGSVLNLYVKPRRSSRADFLVGFLPAANNTGKLQITADVNLNLKNLLGSGESMLLKWQQLQPKSPRLNIGYAQPYVLRSNFGIDLLFDLFRKDSSFLQLNAQAGLQYVFSARQTGKVFVQWQSNTLLPGGIDTVFIKLQKKLPVNIDVRSANVGLQYEWNSTDYRYNPRTGYEIGLTGSVGIKNIQQNNDVISLKDPGFNYASLYDSVKMRSYQFRVRATAMKYFPMGRYAAIKAGLQGGLYASPEIFRNDLFQIGGFRLLRGFDEESIYATKFAVFTAEWRYLVSLNSYLFFFTDAGLVQNRFRDVRTDNRFLGAGIGIMYETKAGLLNVSYAIGKRNDVPFNLREASKLHFGYINYF